MSIDGVVTAADSSSATVTFTLRPAALFCPGAVCDDTLKSAGRVSFTAGYYDAATDSFTTAKAISFKTYKFKGFTADGNGAQYTVTGTDPDGKPLPFAVENSTSGFVYGYVTTASVLPPSGNYVLAGNVASAAKVYGTVPYTSTANVSGCEKCHGAPYSKHGYRQAKVAGLNDFVSCKACHTDQRVGTDANWFVKADDPANYAASLVKNSKGQTVLNDAMAAKYAYTANLMNDVHNSHAFEFNYPQSMANCVTCHDGKLDKILTDDNFRPTVCKSCHVVTGPDMKTVDKTSGGVTGGVEAGRAPSLLAIWANKGVTDRHTKFLPGGTNDIYAATAGGVDANPTACNMCHKAGLGKDGPTFAELHAGYNKSIYSDAKGTRYSDSIKVTVDSTSFEKESNKLTVKFSIAGTAANALVTPTVVIGLYGYDTKDFVVSGNDKLAADNLKALAFTPGNTANAPARLNLEPATATAGTTSWTATADLTTWASLITAGTVKRVQVNILPAIGLDQTKTINKNKYTVPGLANPAYNPPIAVTGATVAIKLEDGKVNATPPGAGIVSWGKCNACHDALGTTTFHSANYGSAGPIACRVCHWVGAGAGALEMQSRSIDSFIHALHSMQYMDIKNVDLTDKVASLRYTDHIEGNYPNFAGPLNCESCHEAGTYEVPDQTKSLPGIISASSAFKAPSPPRNIPNTIAGQITGPAERACGACHRAQMIKEDDASKLAGFYAHTNINGTSVPLTGTAATDATNLTDVTAYLMSVVGQGPTASVVAGAQVESCEICHPRAGAEHQNLFNTWKNGL